MLPTTCGSHLTYEEPHLNRYVRLQRTLMPCRNFISAQGEASLVFQASQRNCVHRCMSHTGLYMMAFWITCQSGLP